VLALIASLAVGSLVEIHAQSGDYRTATDTGYGQLAWFVAEASNQTGSQLAGLMEKAAQLPNRLVPETARAQIEQGLDQAVDSASQQVTDAANLVPPYPTGHVSDRFTEVMTERAEATSDLRTSVDQLLGMAPLPVAGAPSSTLPPDTAPLISVPRASAAMAAVGVLLEHADGLYRALVVSVDQKRIPIQLPDSVWVPSPVADAPLGPTQLGATASALSGSAALVPFHQLVITSVGLSPPAVTTGAPGIVGDSCSAPVSTVPSSSPTVLPPTTSVSVAVTVTNCGTVAEAGVVVSQTLSLADPVGTALPPSGDRGGRARARVTLRSGGSAAPSFPPLPVATGHLYDLEVSVAVPSSQADLAGTSQRFLLQVSG
jgi:flagellar hook-basal body complex protein FliE